MPYSKEERKEYNRKYNESNKEKIADYKRKWREENKEELREKKAKYCQLNKEKIAEYDRKYSREHRKERRSKCIEYLGGKCVKCGATHNLQFDHIKRETKKYTIASRVTQSFTILQEELDKCQLLCAPCHLQKTAQEWTPYKLSTID